MKMFFFFLLYVIIYAPARAEHVESIYFNLGNHTNFYNNVQNDASGGTRKIEFGPTLGAGVGIPLNSDVWRFLTEFNWVLPQTSATSRIIKDLFMLRADFAYDPLKWLRIRAGSSLMLLNQHGRGGSTSLSNGNSQSTFYYPDENHSSFNNTVDLGVEFMPDENWALRLQTYTYSLFEADRRQVSYTIFLTYYWQQGTP
jgi:opacity protein-like surface antigen